MKYGKYLGNIVFTGCALLAVDVYGVDDPARLNSTVDTENSTAKPNIIFIMADDLGYGDLSCLNPDSKISTPNLDALAARGMCFANAHSPSAVCTPTRYGVLTGRYCWRTRLKNGTLNGFSKRLIDEGRLTVASMLHDNGYRTGCVGKWHLGLTDTQPVDFSKPLVPGPNEVGFDYWFGIPSSLDMAPYCYIENGKAIEPLSATLPGEPMPRFYREGASMPGFDIARVLPDITTKACAFINEQVKDHASEPFFLYFPLTAPHTPWVPLDEYNQRSKAGIYGDFVTQVDATVGQIISTVEAAGVRDNTLIIFTSDNGSHIMHIGKHDNDVSDTQQDNFGHSANYIYRGQKSDVWDGGHHVPFIVSWPGIVADNSQSDQEVCLVDFTATCADILGYKLPDNAAEDSFSILPALKGVASDKPVREATVYHSNEGKFAIRKGQWKFIDCAGSGGWTTGGDGLPGQLYDMAADPGETKNLYQSPEHQAIITELKSLLQKYKTQGHSRPMAKTRK